MPDWTIAIARRGLIASLACIGMAGAALAQDTAPLPPPSVAALPAPNATAAPPAAAPTTPQLTQARLEQLLAPIALYPDPLLAQILMASTYPLEVVEAARWVGDPANRALTGDALANALQPQNWDPSVKALAGCGKSPTSASLAHLTVNYPGDNTYILYVLATEPTFSAAC
jgi:hypothetical protein